MLYGELTAPTAVTDALTARLLSPHEQNLIVAKASLLQIFRINTSVRETQLRQSHAARSVFGDALAETILGDEGGEDFMGDDSQVLLLKHETVGQLVLIEEVQMSGTISGLVNLGPLQNVPCESDCIAISFVDAKVFFPHVIVNSFRFRFYSGTPPSTRSRPSRSISMSGMHIARSFQRNPLVISSKTTTAGA